MPYYLWGNSPFDQTPWEDRIFGPEKGLLFRLILEEI
jgi:hypothetical protein